ncbi:hypothetical protein ROHU_003011 [Labeo rohita]|uniref:Uncharacterized protein n=1 Tax=Labeo rohita TaxID=84645 RepID=A0A498NW25_LABRO|nr:hypothetical protein ROHU_007628 [Labeo rohita]RXN36380.1 hypothetical protein ROHU_003011 [Labeo rohita]
MLTCRMKPVSHEGRTDDKKYDVIMNHETTIDVTELNFPHKPPKESAALTIAEIKTMPANQKISTLQAAVYNIPPTSNTVNIRGTDWELKTCQVADSTSSMELTLWETYMEAVKTTDVPDI